MTTRELVAANLRARMAWRRMTHADLMARFGWSKRTAHNKVAGLTGLTDQELAGLAELFGVGDPGVFFRVPEGFTARSSSACTPFPQVRPHLFLAA
jgi:hypothetical protein